MNNWLCLRFKSAFYW